MFLYLGPKKAKKSWWGLSSDSFFQSLSLLYLYFCSCNVETMLCRILFVPKFSVSNKVLKCGHITETLTVCSFSWDLCILFNILSSRNAAFRVKLSPLFVCYLLYNLVLVITKCQNNDIAYLLPHKLDLSPTDFALSDTLSSF